MRQATIALWMVWAACDTQAELAFDADDTGIALPVDQAPPPGIGDCAPGDVDADGDGWCSLDDCDDANVAVYPTRPEACDGLDNNCVGGVDEGIAVRTWFRDADLDGFGDANPSTTIVADCAPAGFSPVSTDCDDGDADVHPLITRAMWDLPGFAGRSPESSEADRDPDFIADGIDQDCDGVDVCFVDLDGDGYGDDGGVGGTPPIGPDTDLNCSNGTALTAAIATDCDDSDDGTFPGATEVVGDGLDQDCDGVDVCYRDLDDDGYGTATKVFDNDLDCTNASAPTSAIPGDCDDDPATGWDVNPAASEVCDGKDNDCNQAIDEVPSDQKTTWYLDDDGDGFGATDERLSACGSPVGYAELPGDCDDDDANAFPGNTETCDDVDNNCDGVVDEPETALDVRRFFEDIDGNGCIGPGETFVACDANSPGWWAYGSRPLVVCDDTACGCRTTPSPRESALLGLAVLLLAVRRRRAQPQPEA